jgi:hypothetical protein
MVEYKTMKTNRMSAAIEEESDLLAYSDLAIRDATSSQAEELYLVPADIKAKALYQLALMSLARDNPQTDREAPIGYLRQLLRQYPDSELSNQAVQHLDSALNHRTL